jgi:hypothetical protein
MPLKTDGILFELLPRPTKGEDGKPLLYAQPVIERKHTLDNIDDFCAKNYLDSLCQGDNPRLRCYQEGRTWHYVFLRDKPKEEK